MLFPLLGLCYYNVLENKIVNCIVDKKLAYNRLNFYHTMYALMILSTSLYFPESRSTEIIAMSNSIGYFVNDILYILKKNKYKTSDYIFIYHHTVSCIYFYTSVNDPTSYWKLVLFFAELSNLPSQAVYYLIQLRRIEGDKYYDSLKLAKFLQFYIYAFLRVFIGTYLYYCDTMITGYDMLFWAKLPVFLLGYFWSFSMYKNKYHVMNF